MGRNIRSGDLGEVRFNLYGHYIEKGKIFKDDKIKDRFYANYVVGNDKNKSIVNGVIRSRDNTCTIITTSILNDINEDDYCENVFTGEEWRIDSISENFINSKSARPLVERTMVLKK